MPPARTGTRQSGRSSARKEKAAAISPEVVVSDDEEIENQSPSPDEQPAPSTPVRRKRQALATPPESSSPVKRARGAMSALALDSASPTKGERSSRRVSARSKSIQDLVPQIPGDLEDGVVLVPDTDDDEDSVVIDTPKPTKRAPLRSVARKPQSSDVDDQASEESAPAPTQVKKVVVAPTKGKASSKSRSKVEPDVAGSDLEGPSPSRANKVPVVDGSSALSEEAKSAADSESESGGEGTVQSVDDDVFGAEGARNSGKTPVLPLDVFTIENKSSWATSYVVNGDTTVLALKAVPDQDYWSTYPHKLRDSVMASKGMYNNLPPLPGFQLLSHGDTEYVQTARGIATTHAAALSVRSWKDCGLDEDYLISLLRLPCQGSIGNPSTMDPMEVVFKESWSSQGPGSAYTACSKATLEPMTFVMVGVAVECFTHEGQNVGSDGRPPFAKGLGLTGHMYEYERFSSFFATGVQDPSINAHIRRHVVYFVTRNRSKTAQVERRPTDTLKRGKFRLQEYSSPTKRPPPPRNAVSLDFSDKVPVYDGTSCNFNPKDVEGSLRRLSPWFANGSPEVPLDAGVVVGYTCATSKYLDSWKMTFYVKWVVVLCV
ncbi:hypothetical protein MD484_g2075, partial [Candolleomyces efflorescens]